MKPRTIWILTILTLPVAVLITIIAMVWVPLRWCVREWHDSVDKTIGKRWGE